MIIKIISKFIQIINWVMLVIKIKVVKYNWMISRLLTHLWWLKVHLIRKSINTKTFCKIIFKSKTYKIYSRRSFNLFVTKIILRRKTRNNKKLGRLVRICKRLRNKCIKISKNLFKRKSKNKIALFSIKFRTQNKLAPSPKQFKTNLN